MRNREQSPKRKKEVGVSVKKANEFDRDTKMINAEDWGVPRF